MDDFMFGKIMSDKQNCKRLLEIVLHIDPATEIAEPETQGNIRAVHGAKSVIVDVRTRDAQSDYDIEAQKRPRPDLPKRARYYQAMMDVSFLEPGHDYTELRNNYIIFICMTDPFGAGLPVYTFRNRCDEDTGVLLGDHTTKVFLNAAGYDTIRDKELRSLMEYIKTERATSRYTAEIERLVELARTTPRWRREYMDAMMAVRREELAEEQGARKKALEAARNALSLGLSVSQTAQISGLTEDEVQALRDKPDS